MNEPFYIQTSLMLFFAGMIGLIVGSFINVVIYRLPKMIETEWKQQQGIEKNPNIKFNLITPRSQCIFCKHNIHPFENIPVLSYLILNGRCSKCKHKISIRYPLIEFISGLSTAACFVHFGFSFIALAASIFILSLIALAMIDWDTYLLPDIITMPLLWLGLLFNLNGYFVDIYSAVIGAVFGYLILWSIYWIFKLLTHKEGMGYGDFKLLAAVGAWLGYQALPEIVLISSLMALVIGFGMMRYGKLNKNTPIPFGPFISIVAIMTTFYWPLS